MLSKKTEMTAMTASVIINKVSRHKAYLLHEMQLAKYAARQNPSSDLFRTLTMASYPPTGRTGNEKIKTWETANNRLFVKTIGHVSRG